MLSNDITFIYVVAGDNSHYNNLQTSIKSVRRLYPTSKILIGDFDLKFDKNNDENVEILPLDFVKFDKNKTFKHIIWQYKYYVSQFTNTKYNLYLDTDTVLVNEIDNLINDSNGKFLIAKHFWVYNVEKFKELVEKEPETYNLIEFLGLKNQMDFCAAGVFFFERNEKNLFILKQTFDIHTEIYKNRDYIRGIYDEPILNSVLQKNINDTIYYNGAINHCSMSNMPLIIQDGVLYGKNPFDEDYKKITCLHCDKHRRNPSQGYSDEIKTIINSLFEI